MLESRGTGFKSARVYFLLVLTLLIDRAAVQKPARVSRDLNNNYEEGGGGASNHLKNSLVITPKFTGLDCDFALDRVCWWTWDEDNFTEASSSRSIGTILPGQNGFYRINGDEVGVFQQLTLMANIARKLDHLSIGKIIPHFLERPIFLVYLL